MLKRILELNEDGIFNEDKVEVLKTIFPNCFTGNNLDLEKLKQELNQELDFRSEGYELNFLGKNYAKYIADSIDTETVIRPDLDHNHIEDNKDSENIYITGDNLDVLKHLRKSYTEQVSIIYIDPPYNTGGEDFIYKDNFNFTKSELQSLLSVGEEEAERILNMTSNNSSTHSAWLTFMYPRIYLAKELLNDDGLLLASIDDNEHAQLKLLLDDVFGEDNFVGTITWEKRTKSQNTDDAKEMLQSKTEYILVYKKKQQKIRFNLEVKYEKDYPEKDRGGSFRYQVVDQMSAYGIRGRETMIYPIKGILPGDGKQWKWGRDTIKKYEERGDIEVINSKPYIKIRPEDEDVRSYFPFWSHFFDKDTYGTAEGGKKELTKILDTNQHNFETVKPVSLIKKLLFHKKTEENEIILDFFSGSGTTAQAVMELNADNVDEVNNRKYILVQLPEKIKEGTSPYKAGYRNITDIAFDRIKKVSSEIRESGNGVDTGFKHFYVENLAVDTIEKIKEFNPHLLVEDLEVEFEKDTILHTWINQDGHGLIPNIEEIDLDGYIGYMVQDFIYLLDEGFTSTNIDSLLKKVIEDKDFNPTHVVVYGYNFKNFNILTQLEKNLYQLRNEEKNIEVTLIKRY